jgi:hypothetical protein
MKKVLYNIMAVFCDVSQCSLIDINRRFFQEKPIACIIKAITSLLIEAVTGPETSLSFCQTTRSSVRFQILTAPGMRFRVFWDVVQRSHVEVDRRFIGAYCLYHQGDE